MAVKTYSPKDVTVIVGAMTIKGFVEDSFVEISQRGDGITPYDGADGETGRSIDPNTGLEIKINLAQTSESNDYLSELYELDYNTGNALVPIAVKDLLGSTVAASSQAWVVKKADTKFARKIDAREWTIQTGAATLLVGGGR